MVTSPYDWKILEWKEKKHQRNKQIEDRVFESYARQTKVIKTGQHVSRVLLQKDVPCHIIGTINNVDCSMATSARYNMSTFAAFTGSGDVSSWVKWNKNTSS